MMIAIASVRALNLMMACRDGYPYRDDRSQIQTAPVSHTTIQFSSGLQAVVSTALTPS